MNKKLILFIGLHLFFFINYGKNKIIILVSPPRSLSTAFLRMMESRGDFYIMHEPLIKPYDIIYEPELSKNWFRPEAPAMYQEVKNSILEKSKKQNVFIKEMSFSAREFLYNDDLIKKDNVYIIFLLRNPHHVSISFYNKCKQIPNCKQIPDHFEYLMGYKSAWELFENVTTVAKNKPIIIRAEDLYRKPTEIINAFCKSTEIQFMPESLFWEKLGDSFNGKEWLESKYGDHLQHWHKNAINSTGFFKPRTYRVDANSNPTFSEISDCNDRDRCKNAYEENLIYYKKFFKDLFIPHSS